MQVVHLKEGSYIWAPSKRNPKVYRWQSLEEETQHRLFVSPVVEGQDTPEEALEGIKSKLHQEAVHKYHYIMGLAGLNPTTVHHVVGQFGEPEHSFMATFETFEPEKMELAACAMGLVSKEPQLGVAYFERIPRYRSQGMITARIERPLSEINKAMEQIQQKTGIYGWTIVPYDGFFEVVLCANTHQLKAAGNHLMNVLKARVKRKCGKLHYIGGDTREDARKEYIKRIKNNTGPQAKRFLRAVAHNVPREEFLG